MVGTNSNVQIPVQATQNCLQEGPSTLRALWVIADQEGLATTRPTVEGCAPQHF